jgi:hypothetical protein
MPSPDQDQVTAQKTAEVTAMAKAVQAPSDMMGVSKPPFKWGFGWKDLWIWFLGKDKPVSPANPLPSTPIQDATVHSQVTLPDWAGDPKSWLPEIAKAVRDAIADALSNKPEWLGTPPAWLTTAPAWFTCTCPEDQSAMWQGAMQGYRDNTYNVDYASDPAQPDAYSKGYAQGWQQAWSDAGGGSVGLPAADGAAHGSSAVTATNVSGIGCLPKNADVGSGVVGTLPKNVLPSGSHHMISGIMASPTAGASHGWPFSSRNWDLQAVRQRQNWNR